MKKEHGLVPKPEHYACVVDLLSRAGLLSRARKFVEEMPIKPDPMVWRTLLSSCIVHKNIELGELAAKNLLDLEPEDSASYVLLSNMYATEMEQKDPTLYVHSEKLAVTFALLSLPDGIPIRVMKNLRVCSDCHNWIKFISRISNREIVVRDAYRFHHFENGNCSCKDFW
ncbi:unnamed protein product [Linum tenue]|uniref:DYW domain-containing protein n=1 Tax=Linum tenue TaxID=586396 RepID=A0AAV0HGI0_9ROSI|nr:unnamed protein product [Linum tenue]